MKETSYRAMKIHEFKECVYYRVCCDCGNPEHDINLELEKDEDLGMIFLNMYAKLRASVYWRAENIFQVLWNKIKITFILWFKGYIEVEESFILKGPQHIDSFINALTEGRSYLNKN